MRPMIIGPPLPDQSSRRSPDGRIGESRRRADSGVRGKTAGGGSAVAWDRSKRPRCGPDAASDLVGSLRPGSPQRRTAGGWHRHSGVPCPTLAWACVRLAYRHFPKEHHAHASVGHGTRVTMPPAKSYSSLRSLISTTCEKDSATLFSSSLSTACTNMQLASIMPNATVS
jgi:hypothetical protein